MKLLVIGGTVFLGRHVVDAALARGHAVTVFNRGRSAVSVPAGVRWLQGDRQGDLALLAGGDWDAVVDTCGYRPAEVDRMAEALAGRVGRYAFISSVSVYASSATPNAEDAPLAPLPAGADPAGAITGETYGPLKALCEQALAQRLGDRALSLRPGLIVGPWDPTQRFSYWPARLARAAQDGGPVLAPQPAQAPVQWIDGRDLAAFTLDALAAGACGAVNVVCPPGSACFADLLQACAEAAGVPEAPVRWAPAAALAEQGVSPWQDLPLWLPDDAEHAAFMAVPTQRAQALGLRCRPLAHTVADTLAWWRSLTPEAQAFTRAGLTPQREAQVLAALPAD